MRYVQDRIKLRFRGDEGQVSLMIVLAVGLFLLGFVGFGADMTNLFFHRQMAQNAADAACVAAGMDMLVNRTNGTSLGGFTPGTPLDCTPSSTAAPCRYANLNGYNSPGLTAGTESNKVSLSFPASVPGTTAPDPLIAGANPYVQVDVVDRVKVYFASLLGGSSTQDVHALAKCGLQGQNAPVPIVVLDPICQHSFEVSGNASVQIVGGPTKSIQVNSSSVCAAATAGGTCSGNGLIDLSLGGPSYSGSNFGVFGGPGTAPTSYKGGSTGLWQSPAAPIADPWYKLAAPPVPLPPRLPNPDPGCLVATNPCPVPYGTNGCPDKVGCLEYEPGLYSSTIIVVKGFTAIFDPGLYYIAGFTPGNCGSPGTGCLAGNPAGQCRYGLVVDAGGVVRPSTVPGDGSGGTMFYFSSLTEVPGTFESALFTANAGNAAVDPFPAASLPCAGAPAPVAPPGQPLPASFQGNILLGPCTGTYGITAADGTHRHGMLMWDDRANGDLNGQPSMQGGGGLLLGGSLYFHNCPEAPNACAAPPTDYNAFFDLQGTPGSSTYVFGNITTDELIEGGNGSITMELDPLFLRNLLKVALLQ
jgi:putative Flp pilus-assembly TadE/G-like protein